MTSVRLSTVAAALAVGLLAAALAVVLIHRDSRGSSFVREPVGATPARDEVVVVYGYGMPLGWTDEDTVVIDAGRRIAVVDADGGNPVVLATSEREIATSSLAPDGDTVAFIVNGPTTGTVFLADVEEEGARAVASGFDLATLAWSDDSKFIGFRTRPGEWLVVDVKGGEPRPASADDPLRDTRGNLLLPNGATVGEWVVADGRLTREAETCTLPSLSPDRRSIACQYRKTPEEIGSAAVVALR